MTSPLLGSIAKTVGAALKSTMYPVSINRVTGGGVYDPATGEISPPVVASFPCRGMLDSYSSYEIANNLVMATDRKVLILAASLSIIPSPETDTISAQGQTLAIISVRSDPATAVWEIQAR